MKETILVELEQRILIEVLKIVNKEKESLSNFISKIIENQISNGYGILKKSSNNRDMDSLFIKRQSFHEVVEQYEKYLIIQALEQTGGIKTKAADFLKMNRTTLLEKMKRLGIE